MPAHIVSDNREFKGEALGIPPLRNIINSLTGNLTEQEVVELAVNIFNGYEETYKQDKSYWIQISKNQVDIIAGKGWTFQSCRNHLHKFINKYKENVLN